MQPPETRKAKENDQQNQRKPLFPLGMIVSTPGALEACPSDYLTQCLKRHHTGDWGNVCAEDVATENGYIKAGFRVLSAYPIDPAKPCLGWG